MVSTCAKSLREKDSLDGRLRYWQSLRICQSSSTQTALRRRASLNSSLILPSSALCTQANRCNIVQCRHYHPTGVSCNLLAAAECKLCNLSTAKTMLEALSNQRQCANNQGALKLIWEVLLMQEELLKEWDEVPGVFTTSSRQGEGRQQLLHYIAQLRMLFTGEAKPDLKMLSVEPAEQDGQIHKQDRSLAEDEAEAADSQHALIS